jgi:uncharacterized protein YuzE
MNKQVTYDKDAERAYLYLCEPFIGTVASTEELEENDDILIDFGHKVPVVGVEIEGNTAKTVMHLDGKTHIFKKEMTAANEVIYSFRLNDKAVKQSVAHPVAEKIVFVFSDIDCLDFIGIDIYDTESYSEQFLVGN